VSHSQNQNIQHATHVYIQTAYSMKQRDNLIM